MKLKLHKKILTTDPPETKKEAAEYFDSWETKGLKLKSFKVREDVEMSSRELITSHFYLSESYYDLWATFK